MGYSNYIMAKDMISKFDDFEASMDMTDNEIEKCEEKLGIKFSNQIMDFYKTYNYVVFNGNEIFGIRLKDSDILEGNSVAYTLNDRKKYGLNKFWIPFFDYGDDSTLVCFDYSDLNNEGEPKIITIAYNGKEYEKIEIIAEDFGEFLYKLATDVPIQVVVDDNNEENIFKKIFKKFQNKK